MTTNTNQKTFNKHTEDALLTYSSNDLTSIKYSGFKNKAFLKSVNTPNVTEIGELAFSGDEGLETIVAPNCTKIGRKAFYNCKKLESVPTSKVTEIGDHALYNCELIESLSLPLCTKIGTYTSPSTSSGVDSIVGSCFKNCKNLTSVSLPVCTSISCHCFDGCLNLTSLSLPECTSLSDNCFVGCDSLTFLSLPKITTVDDEMLAGLTPNTVLDMPALTTIKSDGFQNSKIKSFSSSSVKTIDTYGMMNIYDIEVIDLMAVTSIGFGAFAFCKKLRKIWIASTCTSINVNSYYRPFTGCSSTCQIYTNCSSKPSGWKTYWNGYVANGTDVLTVHWGATHEQFLAA